MNTFGWTPSRGHRSGNRNRGTGRRCSGTSRADDGCRAFPDPRRRWWRLGRHRARQRARRWSIPGWSTMQTFENLSGGGGGVAIANLIENAESSHGTLDGQFDLLIVIRARAGRDFAELPAT